MLDILRKIYKPNYEPFNKICIDSSILLNNLKNIQDLYPNTSVFPVLKSNAYGHGLKQICQILNKSNVKMIAVDSYPEAQIAYKYFNKKVLIIGEMPLDAYKFSHLKKTEFVIYKSETLKYLSKYGKKINIHIFFNSGMNREGVKDIDQFLKDNKQYLDKVNFNGFCSHFASADEKKEFNNFQLNNFFNALEKVKLAGYNPCYIHMANSAALANHFDKRFTAFRPGLAFYGYNPSPDINLSVKPALEVFSKISYVYKISKGESVSYNNDYLVDNDSYIGLIPFGYFEGLDKSFSNKVSFEIQSDNKNYFVQVAGRVCMNLCCVDLGQNKVKDNTLVKIISKNSNNINSINNLSKISNLSAYEILIRLQEDLRREII